MRTRSVSALAIGVVFMNMAIWASILLAVIYLYNHLLSPSFALPPLHWK